MLLEKRSAGGGDQLRPSDVIRVYAEHSDDVSKTVRRIAGRFGGSAGAECDDLVQTTFLLFYRAVRAGKVDRSLNIGGYLSAIARNVARDWIIGLNREVLVAAIPEETTIALGEPPNDVDVGIVRTYLAGLSAELRHFYVLRFEMDLPLLRIARLLKTSRQRVRTLESRLLGEGRKSLLLRGAGEPRLAEATDGAARASEVALPPVAAGSCCSAASAGSGADSSATLSVPSNGASRAGRMLAMARLAPRFFRS